MINIPMNSTKALDRASLSSINARRSSTAVTADTILSINTPRHAANPGRSAGNSASSASSTTTRSAPAIPRMQIPALKSPTVKGQKSPLTAGNRLASIQACFGWNVLNPECDIDVSAFLLDNSGKVIGDSWFVFYGQTESPDRSTRFIENAKNDREMITIDFAKLNSAVSKIVFVMTINDAFSKKLHFGMIKDAYIRIMDQANRSELVSFRLTDYYTTVISMMIGEIYRHNGTWKFHAVGNGLAKDLAGLCEYYGVNVV